MLGGSSITVLSICTRKHRRVKYCKLLMYRMMYEGNELFRRSGLCGPLLLFVSHRTLSTVFVEIPSTYHINSYVSSYHGSAKERECKEVDKEGEGKEAHKKGEGNGSDEMSEDEEGDGRTVRRVAYRMPLRCVQTLDVLVQGNVHISEACIRQALL